MFTLRCFEYSIAPVKIELDRGVHETLIFGSETAIDTNKTEVIREWYGSDTRDTGLKWKKRITPGLAKR